MSRGKVDSLLADVDLAFLRRRLVAREIDDAHAALLPGCSTTRHWKFWTDQTPPPDAVAKPQATFEKCCW